MMRELLFSELQNVSGGDGPDAMTDSAGACGGWNDGGASFLSAWQSYGSYSYATDQAQQAQWYAEAQQASNAQSFNAGQASGHFGNSGFDGQDSGTDGFGFPFFGASQTAPSGPFSDQANAFANEHVSLQGQTIADYNAFFQAHDDVAKVYDLAQSRPDAVLGIGNNQAATASQVLSAISMAYININGSGGGATGANTQPTAAFDQFAITINPENHNQQDYASGWGNAGVDYVVFHELGHVVSDVMYPATRTEDFGANEAGANTAGRSMEIVTGTSLMSAPPRYGFN